MFEERMLSSAYEVLAVASVNPGDALAEIASAEEAIRAGQRSNDQPVILSILPAEDDEAIAVLALAKQIVMQVNAPYVTRLAEKRSSKAANAEALRKGSK
jgi:hypothetical protein